jgi:pseudaminic acid cytidylyltransferase
VNSKDAIAIIPARGGSKRIPHKNIKLFRGKHLIKYSIEAALCSGVFSRVIISTDCPDIAEIAKTSGAEVPFFRPAELSDDHTGTSAVLLHSLEWLKTTSSLPEFFCCIYATAPFIQASRIAAGLETLKATGCSSAFSVTSFPYPIQRALRITTSGHIEMIEPKHKSSRSQDLEEAYHDAGQFYWARTTQFIAEKSIITPDAAPILLPRHLVQDLDTPEDWTRAEAMYEAHKLLGLTE